MRALSSLMLAAAVLLPGPAFAQGREDPRLEVVAELRGPMPTGITVTPDGRIFVNYPQWGDHPRFAVGEVKDGQVTAWPAGPVNDPQGSDPAAHFISVQSVVADGAGRVWVLDAAAPGFAAPVAGGAKLVAVDLTTGQVTRTLVLEPDVVLPTTYLNDVRLDLTIGQAGVAYITDSSISGPGGLIVVDLASGKALRRLSGHPTTMPDPGFVPQVEGEALLNRPASGEPSPWLVATDGIALSPDGATLYYCALSSRHFYAVPTALLRDPDVTDEAIAAAIQDLGPKAPSDGLAEDASGAIWAGDYEHGAIRRFADGAWRTEAEDPRIQWPDTLSVGSDGYLYFTANQLNRQANFHEGEDQRRQPYLILRLPVGNGPVHLK